MCLGYSEVRKLWMNGPAVSKFPLLTNARNFSSSVEDTFLSLLDEKNVKFDRSIEKKTRMTLGFILFISDDCRCLKLSAERLLY